MTFFLLFVLAKHKIRCKLLGHMIRGPSQFVRNLSMLKLLQNIGNYDKNVLKRMSILYCIKCK